MKITLTNVKLNKTLSDETPAYSAKVFIDGKFIADVLNRGHGGGDEQRYAPGVDPVAINARVSAEMPKLKMEGFDDIATDLETECHTLVWRHDDMKRFVRIMKSAVLFVRTDRPGVFKTATVWGEKLREAHTTKAILNDMPLEDAFDLYLENTK